MNNNRRNGEDVINVVFSLQLALLISMPAGRHALAGRARRTRQTEEVWVSAGRSQLEALLVVGIVLTNARIVF